MRFMLDEGAERRIGTLLRAYGHDVTAMDRDYRRSMGDRDVLALARREQRVLITNDRDFVHLVFNQHLPHAGVILFRIGNVAPEVKQQYLQYILDNHGDDLDAFITVYPHAITVRHTPDR
jgi:predicted nuclease of predicted toxin-antitoxin system